MIIYILLAALIIMLASLSGAIFAGEKLHPWVSRNLRYLIAFSMGVFIAISYHLFTDIFHEAELSVIATLGIALLGAFILEVASRLIPEAHHHHGESSHPHTHSRIDARRMLIGDAVHNIGDGIILVPAFLVDIRVGIATTIAILIHELVQEISEFFVLTEAGYTTKEALARNFATSSTILIGVALSLAVSSVESLHAPLAAFAAGGFVYIILRDLLPHTISSAKTTGSVWKYVLATIIGVGIMFAIQTIIPHEEYGDGLMLSGSARVAPPVS